ncbi:hypothetical protein B6U80_00675 [Candidatus Pacearchaeota archaeon ex4484_26]|nr:MAG: hypothetical protein B6U80_00675 [Candidatus Pacearchaeota archaeon ex4484_26]
MLGENPLTSEIDVGNAFGLPNSTWTGADNINRSNLSGNVGLFLNASIGAGTQNITNVSFYYSTDGGATWHFIGVNNTFNITEAVNNTNYRVYWDTSSLDDANQSIEVNTSVGVNGTTYISSTTAYNITIDNTAPTIVLWGYAVDETGYFQSTHYRANGTGIRFNFTATDTLQFLATCELWFGTSTTFAENGTVIGSTNQLNVSRGTSTRLAPGSASERQAANYSNTRYVNLSDGTYYWNVRCNDTLGNQQSNITNFTLVIDTTAPSSATITVPSSDTEFGTNVEIKCENADATAGVNDTVITITRPRGNTVVKRDWNSTTSVTLTLGSGSEKDLDELGTYKVDCTVKDKAGNSKTASQKTFVISAATSSGGGGGTGAGGIITHSLGALTAEGKTQLIRQNDKATFTIADTLHTATVTNVGTDSATITIESEPITLTIKKGETKKIDFEKDNVYDLAIRLVSIIGSRAQLEFKAISESYAGEAVPYEGAEEEAPEEVPEEVPEEKAPTKTTAIWWIVGIIILIIVIAWIYSATRKKK